MIRMIFWSKIKNNLKIIKNYNKIMSLILNQILKILKILWKEAKIRNNQMKFLFKMALMHSRIQTKITYLLNHKINHKTSITLVMMEMITMTTRITKLINQIMIWMKINLIIMSNSKTIAISRHRRVRNLKKIKNPLKRQVNNNKT